jgi:hypothetical protein
MWWAWFIIVVIAGIVWYFFLVQNIFSTRSSACVSALIRPRRYSSGYLACIWHWIAIVLLRKQACPTVKTDGIVVSFFSLLTVVFPCTMWLRIKFAFLV